MKIGILTFHRPSNFGANLQAYSSTVYYQSLGHDVKVIDYIRQSDIEYKKNIEQRQFEAHKLFVESKLPLTEQVSDEEGLCRVVEQESFDLILIGADAVWRSPEDNCIYFAKWLFEDERFQDIPVASISPAHMGNGFMDQDEETRQIIGNCLRKFKYITVRDNWTKNVINRDIFKGESIINKVNPDPVVMLSKFTQDIRWESELMPKSYYIMSLPKDWCNNPRVGKKREQWFNKFKALVNNAGYLLIELPIPEGKSGLPFDYIVDYPIDPLQWFLWIKNAKAFCGLRFHAIVSSIANGTPFYSVDSYADKSKVSKVLDLVGLHKIARKRDKASKIHNLLEDSLFETFRTGPYLEFECPSRVFRHLEDVKSSVILEFRDLLRNTFESNISEVMKSVENG